MWQIDNRTPFAAERAWVRDREGAEIWIVAVKATFDVGAGGALRVSAQQPPVVKAPEYEGEPGHSSLRYDSDLVLTKATTDIVVVGHAHAPEGHAVRSLDVGLRVGPVRKVIKVFGDRQWGAMGPGAPQPFVRMPLVWERAFGGTAVDAGDPEKERDWRNPVGCGYATSGAAAEGVPLPNMEAPDKLVASWRDRPPPAGLGPVNCHWQPRVGYGGTYDQRWLDERQPLWPQDLDDRFFQCAPADQQAPCFLVGGEPVALLGMSPAGFLRFQLPRLHLGFETFFYGGGSELHQDRKLHTVILEPDGPRVSLVWHSALPCHFAVTRLEQTVITLKTTLNPREAVPDDEPEFA